MYWGENDKRTSEDDKRIKNFSGSDRRDDIYCILRLGTWGSEQENDCYLAIL